MLELPTIFNDVAMNISLRAVSSPLLLALCAAGFLAAGCSRHADEPQAALEEEQSEQAVIETTTLEPDAAETSEMVVSNDEPVSIDAVNEDQEVEEPASYPPLPALVDIETTNQELTAMALQAALAEEGQGLIETEAIAARQDAIVSFWEDELAQLREVVGVQIAEREAYNNRERELILQTTEWDRQHQANLAIWDKQVRDEKLRVLPLVPPDLHERLVRQLRTTDPQRSRWCFVME